MGSFQWTAKFPLANFEDEVDANANFEFATAPFSKGLFYAMLGFDWSASLQMDRDQRADKNGLSSVAPGSFSFFNFLVN